MGASLGRLGEALAGDSCGDGRCSSYGRFGACAALTAAQPAVGSMLCRCTGPVGGGGGGKLPGGTIESAGRHPVRLEGGGRGSGGLKADVDVGRAAVDDSAV